MDLLISVIVPVIFVISALLLMYFSEWDIVKAISNLFSILIVGALIIGICYFLAQIVLAL